MTTKEEGSRPAPTISQVAEQAGVSRSTVSRAFTRPEILSAETVERVMQAARALGYVPNQLARALSTGRNGNIALVVPDVANPFFPPLIRAAQRRADSVDFCVFLGDSDEDAGREDRLLERFIPQVEGLVLASSRLADENLRARATRRPMVLINRDIAGIPRVLIDSSSGVMQAVEHLARLGHRRIAYVSGPSASWSNRQRRTAIRRAAARLGVSVTTIPTAKPTYDEGRRVVGAIIASGVSGAVAFDDLVAQGVLNGLAAKGMDVPRQFSVVGCDDVLGAMTYPPLTTVSSRSAEAGEAAVQLLMDSLKTGANRDVRLVLGTHLVERATTAPPAKRAGVARS